MENGFVDTGSCYSAVSSPRKIVFKGWLNVELISSHLKYWFLLSTENVSSLIRSHWFVSLSKAKRSTNPQYQTFSSIYSSKSLSGCRHWGSSFWCFCWLKDISKTWCVTLGGGWVWQASRGLIPRLIVQF